VVCERWLVACDGVHVQIKERTSQCRKGTERVKWIRLVDNSHFVYCIASVTCTGSDHVRSGSLPILATYSGSEGFMIPCRSLALEGYHKGSSSSNVISP